MNMITNQELEQLIINNQIKNQIMFDIINHNINKLDLDDVYNDIYDSIENNSDQVQQYLDNCQNQINLYSDNLDQLNTKINHILYLVVLLIMFQIFL